MAGAPPVATETPHCPVCGSAEGGIVVGLRGRFGMDVRNVACARCALVYQTPRPSRAAMADYYAGAYREHYGDVQYPKGDGASVGPGQPGFAEALDAWHGSQAGNALLLGDAQRGDRVLEIGCRHGRTLCFMRDRVGIEPYGVEPGPEQAEEARAAGVRCFTGTLEEFDPGALRFEQIQLFHVLEHLHDPLAGLVRMRGWLAGGGRLVIEVPNVYQPYGLLEENFFQNAHLTNFSVVTLPALLARAGFRTTRALDRSSLFVSAAPDDTEGELPRPFDDGMLSERGHDPGWVAARLATYARLEKLRVLLRVQGPSMELVNAIVVLLRGPGFVTHTVETVSEVVEFFVRNGAPRAAAIVAGAAAMGPHAPEVRAGFEQLFTAISRTVSAA